MRPQRRVIGAACCISLGVWMLWVAARGQDAALLSACLDALTEGVVCMPQPGGAPMLIGAGIGALIVGLRFLLPPHR